MFVSRFLRSQGQKTCRTTLRAWCSLGWHLVLSNSTLPGVLFFFFLLRTQAEFFTYIPSSSSQFTLMPSSSPWAVHENTSPYLLCNIILGFRRACNGIGRALGSAQWAQSRRRPYFFLDTISPLHHQNLPVLFLGYSSIHWKHKFNTFWCQHLPSSQCTLRSCSTSQSVLQDSSSIPRWSQYSQVLQYFSWCTLWFKFNTTMVSVFSFLPRHNLHCTDDIL